MAQACTHAREVYMSKLALMPVKITNGQVQEVKI